MASEVNSYCMKNVENEMRLLQNLLRVLLQMGERGVADASAGLLYELYHANQPHFARK